MNKGANASGEADAVQSKLHCTATADMRRRYTCQTCRANNKKGRVPLPERAQFHIDDACLGGNGRTTTTGSETDHAEANNQQRPTRGLRNRAGHVN